MNPISLVHLHKLLLPSSRSHWSATEPRSKTQPTATAHTHSRNTHDTAAGSPNRSGRFLKPVRPLLLDLASRRQGKPVRPVWQTGQTGFVQKLPKDPKHLKRLSTSEQMKPWCKRDFVAHKPFSTAHREKPVRPVRETGQAGVCLDSREEHSPREKLHPSTNRSPDSFHGSKWDFGDRWGTSWANLG
jgi:hypothetical protein